MDLLTPAPCSHLFAQLTPDPSSALPIPAPGSQLAVPTVSVLQQSAAPVLQQSPGPVLQ